jgi:hypothetical protein
MKHSLTFLLFMISSVIFSQEKNGAQVFWEQLQGLCGQAFEGSLVLPKEDEQFGGKKLIMHVRSCSDTVIKIPFFVGEDKSRTWILTYKDDRIELKHDHRHEDGSEDEITMYGGITTNSGQSTVQIFSADQHTTDIIPLASSNVWWITLDDAVFSYNLRRVDTIRVFKVDFDLKNPVALPEAPWGWKED